MSTAAPPVAAAPDPPSPADPSPAPGTARRRRRRAGEWVLAGLAGVVAVATADYCGVVGIDAVDDAARVLAVATALFGVAGYGLVRLALPEALRRHEVLWYVPVGACAIALAMTVLGFAQVPYRVNLAVVVAGAVVLAVRAHRRAGPPARPPELRAVAWPIYLAALLAALALIPMFRSGFATVVGQGQDAHMAAGTAEFLKHAPPNAVRPELPVDQEWLTWRSKQAIYYATAAVSTLSAMETYEVLSSLAALLFALSAIGMFLVARELFGAGAGLAALAMCLASLDRMVLHTAMHPYYNQIWGYMTMPLGLVLAWRLANEPARGTAALLGIILAVDFFAYPLAGPITLTALGIFLLCLRRDQLRPRVWLRRLRALPRRVKWPLAVVVFLLLGPIWGAFEKITGATQLLINPVYSLELWGGDLTGYYAEPTFFAIPDEPWWPVPFAVVAAAALWQLTRVPRALALGLGALLLAGAFVVGTMRLREYGWYFHFKMLAFIGPLVVVMAAVALRRVRYVGLIFLFVWINWALQESRDEAAKTFDELPRTMLELRDWARAVPPDASIRLDMDPGKQTWSAYMLHTRRLCSQRPLDDTAYPHVQYSRAADYVLVRRRRKPFDAVGEPLLRNVEFALYRLRPGLPGGDRCSQRMVQTVTRIDLR